MEILTGFLIAVLLVVAPFVRPNRFDVECVATKKDCPIEGVIDLFKSETRANMLIVHGMGAGDPAKLSSPAPNYTDFANEIAVKRLGLKVIQANQQQIKIPGASGCPALLIKNVYSDGTKTLTVAEVQWWPLIIDARTRLIEDDAAEAPRRALLNNKLKNDLVNSRIADPIPLPR